MIYTVTLNPTLDRTFHVPDITFNDVLRATYVKDDISGKGLNVSLALKELGILSTATGFLGGYNGRRLEDGMLEAGIPCDFQHIAGETRSNVVIIEESTGRYVKANEAGPAISEEEQHRFLAKIASLAAPEDIWIFSGSLPPGLPLDFYSDLIEIVQGKGGCACLDSSTEMLQQGLTAHPWLVKPNLLEAYQASGKNIETEEDALGAVDFFLERGVEVVALTMGELGLLLAAGNERIRVRPPLIQVKNPTAAGDALLAGMLYARQNGASWTETARWGVAAGAAAAMQDGSGIGEKELVTDLLIKSIGHYKAKGHLPVH